MASNDWMRAEKTCSHPGKIIREDYLKPLGITISEFASVLGVSRKTLSKILNGRGAVIPDMALRLSRAFDTTADFWLNLQKNHDLWQAEHTSKDWQRVKPLSAQLLHSHL
jgi:addiction module HigA family antidote